MLENSTMNGETKKKPGKIKTVSILFSPDRSIHGVYSSEAKAKTEANKSYRKLGVMLSEEQHELK